MAFTRVGIILLAVSRLGNGGHSTIANAGPSGTAAELEYDVVLDGLISAQAWRFCTRLGVLSRLVEEPTSAVKSRWQYIFKLPADYLGLIRLYPYTRDFQIYENKLLYANQTAFDIEYRFRPDPSLFPNYFVNLLAHLIAINVAKAVSNNAQLIVELRQEAIVFLNQALAADSQSHPNQAIVHKPYINVRT